MTDTAQAGSAPAQVPLVVREFAAPRQRVFEAWTTPEHVARWWGPTGFTNVACEVDPRPGGSLYVVMQGPDGTDYPMRGTFEEVTPPERLVFIGRAEEPGGAVALEVRHTVTFESLGDGTRITLHSEVLHVTEVGRGYLAGMEMGWILSLHRLADHLAGRPVR